MNDVKRQGGILELLSVWAACRRGSIVLYMALIIPVMTAVIGLGIDVTQNYMVKERLSRALDAAALAAAGSAGLTEAEMQARVDKFMAVNYPTGKIGSYYDVKLTRDGDHITVTGSAKFKTGFMRFIDSSLGNVTTTARTQVTRKVGSNIELVLVLDTSNSMNDNGKIDDLKEAAKSLVDTVVYTDQSTYFSKIAIVPYGIAVNVNTDANATKIRGAVTAAPFFTITAVTKANTAVVTANGHGFSNGDLVYISGETTGMTEINNKEFKVQGKTTNTFQLYTSGIGSNSVAVRSTNFATYKPGGKVSKGCTSPGCDLYRFSNATSNAGRIFPITNCVTERTGFYAYTEDPPSTSYVGRNYAGAPCTVSKIRPLTANTTVLKADIDALTASGSTGGQVGIYWGWYMLSPNFGYLWTDNESAPQKYTYDKLHKVAVIMTDGELNSPYCNGVVSKDATSGSGSSDDHINCNATNGSPYAQGQKVCDAMKKAGIEIYTIGFKVDAYPNGKALMQYCATNTSHFYDSKNGDDLKAAFRAIAQNVNQLYVSQ